MSVICTLDEVKKHLRYDTNDSDLELQIYLDVAEQIVFNYVDEEYHTAPFPEPFRIAVLVLCGYHDEYRNGEGVQKMHIGADTAFIEGNYIPAAARWVLFPYRTLTAV